MQLGQRVILTRDVIPWYAGYGANRAIVLPAGLAGTVTHVDVPPVRGDARTPSYNVARFQYAGESWQTSEGFILAELAS